MTNQSREQLEDVSAIAELLDHSSFGTDGARSLRKRPVGVREIVHQTNPTADTVRWAAVSPDRGNHDLVMELKALRKGRGLFAGRFEERVGPTLRAACDVTDGDGLLVIRQKVAACLTELAGQLPEDLRLAALAAFAINAEARLPLYEDRVRWAATISDHDPRTIRQRVDEAITQLAKLATNAPRRRLAEPTARWHTTGLRVVAALDRKRPEVLEQRRIVADHNGVRELDFAVSLPTARHDLEVGVYYGGTLRDQGEETTGRYSFALKLPTPLSKGETHDFAVWFRLPTEEMRPYLMCVPRHPCDLFDLRVRFAPTRVPPQIFTMNGAFQRDVSDPVYGGAQHRVDNHNEIHMRFRNLTPGLAYGVRWTPAPPSSESP